MTTIHLSQPTAETPAIQVFGSYDGDDDRYVFGVREFNHGDKARDYARRLARLHKADRTEGF